MPDTTMEPRAVALRRALRARARLLITLLCALFIWAFFRSAGGAHGESLERSLALYLQRHERLELSPSQVVWLAEESNWLGLRPVLFAARHDRELHDVYYGHVRVSGRSVIDLHLLTNITRTSSADEDRLAHAEPMVAYAARVGDAYDALVVLDTRGEPRALTHGWPTHAKLQNALTNLQDTGRLRAFGVRRYSFLEPPDALELQAQDGRIVARAQGRNVVVEVDRDLPVQGEELVHFERAAKGQPGLVTWVVDTVRRISFIGPGPIEWLEHKVFGLTDRAARAYHEVVPIDTEAEVKHALAVQELPSEPEPPPTEEDLDIGFPPPSLSPLLPDGVQGEGVWMPIANDPFVPERPNAPPLFYQTFLRVDPERTFTRVYYTLWDPRQIQLGIVMGTKEPESATGETGSGRIPRDPHVLSRLVGAFNGGFQAMHGEFGMMAERRVYLPPKPFAATVAVFEDGRVGMGSWPGPGRKDWDEELANSQIPRDVIAMRQNLTSVVEGDQYNPWKRWWWGAAPEWAEEQTFIHRSGLCLTQEGFLAYLWGESMGPEQLGKAMLAARCVRGMHLDMNSKHTGFELYRPVAPGGTFADLGRPLSATEFEGPVAEAMGFRFRARLAVATMTPLRFPRYLGRDPRDFFYLVRKPLLPGADLVHEGASLPFSTRGLPQPPFPLAFAQAVVPGASPVRVVRIDATRAVPGPIASASSGEPLAYLSAVVVAARAGDRDDDELVLHARRTHGLLRLAVSASAPAGTSVLLRGPALGSGASATAAVGVDGEGFLVYVEAADAQALASVLASAGVDEKAAIALPESARLLLAGEAGLATLSGKKVKAPPGEADLALLAETRPAAEVLFPDVKPEPYRKWGWMQDQRVRYFPSGPSRFRMPEEAK